MTDNKKVLFLCDRYGQPNDANGICVKNVAREFLRRGYQTFCIYNSGLMDKSFSEDGVTFVGLKQSLYDSISNKYQKNEGIFKLLFWIFSMLRRAVLIPFYPNVSPLRSHRYATAASHLIAEENIGLVIGAYRPFESIFSLFKIKQKFKGRVFCVAYHLDVLTSPNTKNKWIKVRQKKRAWNVFAKECEKLDLIVLPSVLEKSIPQSNKVKYADFPVCDSSSQEEGFMLPYVEGCLNFVYVGTLNTENRNPAYAIDLFERISAKIGKKAIFHIWGNIDSGVNKQLEKAENVLYHGLLAPERVMFALKGADFIVNIANEQTPKMVPSKIFQYFSTHKPIFNFVSSDEDCSVPFFEKYGYAVTMYKNNGIEHNMELAMNFIENIEKYRSRIDETFLSKSTPAFFANVVENENGF